MKKLRAKQHKQKTDEVTDEEVKQPNLFTNRLVESDLVYECIRNPQDAPVRAGAKVRLVDMKNDILVFRGTKPIGYVAPAQEDTLRANVGLARRKGRGIGAVVTEVSEITPSFFVHVKE